MAREAFQTSLPLGMLHSASTAQEEHIVLRMQVLVAKNVQRVHLPLLRVMINVIIAHWGVPVRMLAQLNALHANLENLPMHKG